MRARVVTTEWRSRAPSTTTDRQLVPISTEGNALPQLREGSDDAPTHMTAYSFTDYFETEVLRKRPYLKREWCIHAIENAVRSGPQGEDRYRFWAPIPELEGRYLRVITLEDRVTIHNAFPDRRFKP
jgi:hypothetical protein